ncbi:RNA pseudouridine synthase [Roseivirga seohaensis]|uniref:Pseudouridylate synthase n=2 Tax=Roseivirga seohaensis TaxID=1914963 RepID=A0A0L8AK88_9BACT|nr:RluA family pseudouridine synthase [Roseivirga seohaensis]KOF02647.1 pseudouridylate synthase [Roseivirga seohaensis subsp. aquiponti]KYG84768.1 RNA pseudouridine synthase [Roseivirga seohaensis]|tara:strand:+ start:55 stop:762 length:708 start_codon:yes stop_codon:yes gene_type:complete
MKIKFEDLICYENDHFLVINKPAHMASLDDRNDPKNVQKLAKDYSEHLSVCHRLDKDTSGCLLLAKGAEAYRHASIQFEKRNINKIYHAFVDGLTEFREERVALSILPLDKGIVVINKEKGKEAETYFTTLENFKSNSLIECRPITGRMHQIRIHLATLKAPIINDEMYGGKPLYLSQLKKKFNLKREEEERPIIQRFALHAYALSFNNFSEQITVKADYPKDMQVLYKQLKKYR